MDALLASSALVTFFIAIIAILIAIAPLMIWSQMSVLNKQFKKYVKWMGETGERFDNILLDMARDIEQLAKSQSSSAQTESES